MSSSIQQTTGQKSKAPVRTIKPSLPFFTLGDEIDRLFSDFGIPMARLDTPNSEFSFVPSVEVKELKTRIVVKVEVPGVAPEDVKIVVDGDTLKLSGEKHVDDEHEEDGKTISEHKYGSFYRAIALSSEVVTDKVSAKSKDGVITVTLPRAKPAKHEEEKAVNIPINKV